MSDDGNIVATLPAGLTGLIGVSVNTDQGTVRETVDVVPKAIPTLGDWGLTLLAALLVGVGALRLRSGTAVEVGRDGPEHVRSGQ